MYSLLTNPEQFIFAHNQELKTTSLKVAEAFRKQHKHVLRDIEKIIAATVDIPAKPKFGLSEYEDSTGRKLPMYEMGKDAFMLLVMGYNGVKAMAIKIAYINAFNLMYDKLFNHPPIAHEKPTQQSKTGGLTLDQQDVIKNIVRSTAESLPKEKRASATIKMWSAIKKKFGCTYKEVPEEEFNNVVSLLARLPIEGELLPKPGQQPQQCNLLNTTDKLILPRSE